MKTNLTILQRMIDAVCVLLCIGTIVYVLMVYRELPEQIPTNFSATGEIRTYGSKASLFFLIAVMLLLTGSFSIMLRLKSLYRHINVPWTIPWGKKPWIVGVTKTFLCWSNLLVTAGNAYLVFGCIRGKIELWIWIPYVVMVPLTVWYLVRIRRICKS